MLRTDLIPKVTELGESLQAMIGQSSLKVALQPIESAAWRTLLWANKPGQERSDLLIAAASNNQFDSNRVLRLYFGTGQYSQSGGPEFQAKVSHAGTLKGEERVKAYQAIWRERQLVRATLRARLHPRPVSAHELDAARGPVFSSTTR